VRRIGVAVGLETAEDAQQFHGRQLAQLGDVPRNRDIHDDTYEGRILQKRRKKNAALVHDQFALVQQERVPDLEEAAGGGGVVASRIAKKFDERVITTKDSSRFRLVHDVFLGKRRAQVSLYLSSSTGSRGCIKKCV
jgi:hypothetical protein